MLKLLLLAAGDVVDYSSIYVALYGERVPVESCRARLKSLVADIRRRFGADMQAALLTAAARGLVLQLKPAGSTAACSETDGRSCEACAFDAHCTAVEFRPLANAGIGEQGPESKRFLPKSHL